MGSRGLLCQLLLGWQPQPLPPEPRPQPPGHPSVFFDFSTLSCFSTKSDTLSISFWMSASLANLSRSPGSDLKSGASAIFLEPGGVRKKVESRLAPGPRQSLTGACNPHSIVWHARFQASSRTCLEAGLGVVEGSRKGAAGVSTELPIKKAMRSVERSSSPIASVGRGIL